MTRTIRNKHFFFLAAAYTAAVFVSLFIINITTTHAVDNIAFKWKDPNTITMTYGRYCGGAVGTCNESVELTGSYPNFSAEGVLGDASNSLDTATGCLYKVSVVMSTDPAKGKANSELTTLDGGCDPAPFNQNPITVGNQSAAPTDPAVLSKGTNGTADGKGKDSCGVRGLGWLVCPVLGFIGEVSDQLFSFLATEFLSVDTALYNTNSPTYQAWSLMRNIANVAFVIAFMIIIFSQVSGVGINNYGIKKMLPRLIIAAILVNLSYLICQIAVDLSNIAGYSIKGLFDGVIANLPQAGEGGATGNGLGIAALVTGIIAGGVTIALAATVPVLLAVLAALILIVFILLARKALIVLLIVIAPLAFVAYLLPNTEQWYKKWQKMLVALLVVFPVISAIFGASMLASRIVKSAAEKTDDDLTALLALGIAIIPLIMVPTVLKGSITAAGAIGATMKGLADRNTKGIGGKVASTSRLGQLQKHIKTEGERRRALVQAGQYKGSRKNPLNWGRRLNSRINREINDAPWSGKFGDRSAAAGVALAEKIEDEEVANTEKLMRTGVDPNKMISHASEELQDAIAKNDIVKARAAQKILLNSGNKGLEELTSVLESSVTDEKTKTSDAVRNLRTDLNSAGLKGKNNVLASWAYNGDDATISDTRNTASTYELSDTELAGQSASLVEHAVTKGMVSALKAQSIIDNQNLYKDMSEANLRQFEIAAGRPSIHAGSGTAAPAAPPPGAPQPTQPVPGVNQQSYGQTNGGLYIPHSLNQPPSGGNNSAGGNNNNNGNNNAGTP